MLSMIEIVFKTSGYPVCHSTHCEPMSVAMEELPVARMMSASLLSGLIRTAVLIAGSFAPSCPNTKSSPPVGADKSRQVRTRCDESRCSI